MANEKDENLPVPLRSGDVQIATEAQLADLLDDTTGAATGLLDGLIVARQGKEDYFKIGEEKKGTLTGIFLFSKRPTRAFWASDEISDKQPDCFSFDGITPHPIIEKPQSPKCGDCMWDKIGSGKGRQKKCKQKAADFVLFIQDNLQTAGEGKDRIAMVGPENIVGSGVVMYSISNRGTPAAYQQWLRKIKEDNMRPQGCVTRWRFGTDKSKVGNVTYNYVELEYVLPILGPKDDPKLWNLIVSTVSDLKTGKADKVLLALTGVNKEDAEEAAE